MKLKYIILLVFTMGLFASCDPNDTMDTPKTEILGAGQMLPGEWWVTYTVDGADIYGVGYTMLSTYNNADNASNKLFITDNENFWSFKVEADADINANTFSITDGTELLYDDATTITNGKVIPGGGTTKGGNVTDSIYMEIVWASEPGTTYVASGVRRTGFLEDEY